MVAIAFDRYFCICHPFLHAITIPRAKIIVFIMGVSACLLGIITSLCHGIFQLDDTTASLNVTESEPAWISTISSLDTINYQNSTVKYDVTTTVTGNVTNIYQEEGIVPGMCIPNTILLKKSFIDVYQKIYAGLYLISFLIVLVLYGLIYRSIHIRRALKAKRKRSSLFPAAPNDYSAVDTQMTILNNGNEVDGKYENGQKRFRKKSLGLKDKVFYANIRTAVMLFIVTIVFLIAFLPAWLMAHELVTYNMIVFYMYFIYNVANPIIYAFMNNSFRDDLQNIFKRKCNAK
jgi:cholecystokinin A receptor/hypocretin (orexin) receptor 2